MKLPEGIYYVNIYENSVINTATQKDVTVQFTDLISLGRDLGLDIDGDFIEVKDLSFTGLKDQIQIKRLQSKVC